jgi:DNA-binding CsgD family transcriptional regulator
LGFLELSLGDVAAAERVLAPAAELLTRMGVVEPGCNLFPPDLLEALVALGRLDRASQVLRAFEATAEELKHPWATATGLRCRALLCAARGDRDGALRAIELGLEAHRRIPEPFELARMHLVAGKIRRRLKQKGRARADLERALALFEHLPTPLWASRARGELSRIGLRAADPGGLTPTEQRIADLVVAGRGNREIADALFLSPRTVEANLTRIYRKVGVRSRTELVRRVGGGTS